MVVTKDTPIWQLTVGQFQNLVATAVNTTTPKKPVDEIFLTKPLASDFIGKSENALGVMVCKKQIAHIKKGGRLYFRKSDLIEYLESGRVDIEPINAVDVLAKKKGEAKLC